MIKILPEWEIDRHLLFIDNFKQLMLKKGISGNKLARLTGMKQTQISAFRTGKVFPTYEQAEKLAKALECTVQDFFDDTYKPWTVGEPENKENE